jgi:site-specific recombinase XerD
VLSPESLKLQIQNLEIERSRYKRGRLSHNTQLGYGYDFNMFKVWALEMQLCSLPATPETVSLYITDLLGHGHKVTTASRRACAIAHHHRAADVESPVNREIHRLLIGAKRVLCQQSREMHPLSLVSLRKIARVLTVDGSKKAIRDRAMMVVGFTSALRRSSLTALRTEDIEFVAEGVVLFIPRDKTDQESEGRYIGLPLGQNSDTCPVRCLQAWMDLRGTGAGFVFTGLRKDYHGQQLRGEAVCRLVKACMKRIGISPDRYGGHSLRSGFITETGERGANLLLISSQTGHRDLNMLRRYFRRSNLFKSNACAVLGL